MLSAATFAAAGLNFGVQLLLARVLGAEQFGAFSSSLAMVMLVTPLAGFGLAGYWLKVYGREGWAAKRWLPESLRFLLLSASLVVSAVLGWAWFGPHDVLTTTLLTLLATHILAQPAIALASARYQLEGRHLWLAGWQALPHVLRFAMIGALVVVWGPKAVEARHAAIVFAITAVVVVLFGAYQVGQMVAGTIKLEGHGPRCGAANHRESRPGVLSVMSGAWPFGLAGLFYLIYFQSDIILIRYLVDEAAAGMYNVAFVVMAAVYLFPSVLYQKFLLPKLHRWAYHDTNKLHSVYRIGNVSMLLLGFAAMVLLWLLVPDFLPWLFGQEYSDAVTLLMILAVAAPFRFLATSTGAIMTTRNYMRIKVRLMGFVAVINVLLNLVLIPLFGAIGAAVSTVLSDAVLSALYYYFSARCALGAATIRDGYESV